MQKLYIKNMVCSRCIMVVQQELDKLDAKVSHIQLGEVSLSEPLSADQNEALKVNLQVLGFELLDDQRQKLIEKIKNIIIESVHHQEQEGKTKYSDLLSHSLNKDYSYLSNLFSEVEGITIEKYIIEQKIEKVKELLLYDEMNLSEIAYKMEYSSVAHLSSQFKKVTGFTPSSFKQMGINGRRSLDKV